MSNNKVTIIGIAGGTGSGKTTVVKKIVEALPPHHVAVVPLDSYYNDTTEMTEEDSESTEDLPVEDIYEGSEELGLAG